jgi:hypothetical protein
MTAGNLLLSSFVEALLVANYRGHVMICCFEGKPGKSRGRPECWGPPSPGAAFGAERQRKRRRPLVQDRQDPPIITVLCARTTRKMTSAVISGRGYATYIAYPSSSAISANSTTLGADLHSDSVVIYAGWWIIGDYFATG